jgi:hypothetical protein
MRPAVVVATVTVVIDLLNGIRGNLACAAAVALF